MAGSSLKVDIDEWSEHLARVASLFGRSYKQLTSFAEFIIHPILGLNEVV